MARVPRISYDNAGNLLAIRAILEGGRARQRGYEIQGAAIGGALTRAGESIGFGLREKKDRAERASVRRDIAADRGADRAERQADREEGRRMQKARFALSLINADAGILDGQRSTATREVQALEMQLAQRPELKDDADWQGQWKAATGKASTAEKDMSAISGRVDALRRETFAAPAAGVAAVPGKT